MMLEMRDEDFVARNEAGTAVGLRDKVDRLRRATHEDDLGGGRRIDEALHFLAGTFEQRRRLLRERVHGAVHVGVMAPRVLGDSVDHSGRLLRGSRIVEVGERMAVDPPREHREVAANAPEVKRNRRFADGSHQAIPRINSRSGSAPARSVSATARTGATGKRPVTSRQNANVRSARAVSRSSPRDTR